MLLFVIGCFSRVASADEIPVGDLSFDNGIVSSTFSEFDVFNYTGSQNLAPAFPITTPLTFDITSETVDLVGGTVDVIPGSDFTADAAGDEFCLASGCNFYGEDVTRVTVAGTLSPITGLSGLPAGDTGIDAPFSVTLAAGAAGGCGLTATGTTTPILDDGAIDGCFDSAIVNATGVGGSTATPEPPTVMLLGAGLIGLLLGFKLLSGKQITTTA